MNFFIESRHRLKLKVIIPHQFFEGIPEILLCIASNYFFRPIIVYYSMKLSSLQCHNGYGVMKRYVTPRRRSNLGISHTGLQYSLSYNHKVWLNSEKTTPDHLIFFTSFQLNNLSDFACNSARSTRFPNQVGWKYNK
jgi:hypothetical protein